MKRDRFSGVLRYKVLRGGWGKVNTPSSLTHLSTPGPEQICDYTSSVVILLLIEMPEFWQAVKTVLNESESQRGLSRGRGDEPT